jgi:hypothetical protein
MSGIRGQSMINKNETYFNLDKQVVLKLQNGRSTPIRAQVDLLMSYLSGDSNIVSISGVNIIIQETGLYAFEHEVICEKDVDAGYKVGLFSWIDATTRVGLVENVHPNPIHELLQFFSNQGTMVLHCEAGDIVKLSIYSTLAITLVRGFVNNNVNFTKMTITKLA